MTKARPLTVALAAAGAVTFAAALGIVGGRVAQGPRMIRVSDDIAVTTFPSDAVVGAAGRLGSVGDVTLAAGGLAGGAAISYLKFKVDLPAGVPPRHAEIWLARDSGKLPSMVELSTVPWSTWEQRGITAGNAPRLGTVVASVFPTGYETALHFDVSDVIRKAGEYAFALTAPTSDSIGLFVAQESESGRAPTLTMQWETIAASAAAALKRLPSRTGLVAPPQTGQEHLQLPPWLPEDARPVWVPETPPAPVPSGGDGVPSPPPPPSPTGGGTLRPSPSALPGTPSGSSSPTSEPSPSGTPWESPSPPEEPSPSAEPSGSPSGTPPPSEPDCEVGSLGVPNCGVLWGVAPGAHTDVDRTVALHQFEQTTERPQAIYHAYHRGDEMFPTPWEIAIARDKANPRMLFLNWKPARASWRAIADGDPWTEAYLDRLAAHVRSTFAEPFFFTMHHEPEDDVRTNAMLGMTAKDYAAAYRHVVQRLRGEGVTNLISTMVYMAYVPWNTKSWFADLYPGDDVVDWIGWDAYAYSDPGYGHGDFAEMMNRTSGRYPDWPGFYTWAAKTFPTKPFMVAEWGVWYSAAHPAHQSEFFASVGRQMQLFPRVKAMVYFETPHNQVGMDSRVHNTPSALNAYRELGNLPVFQVRPESG